MRFWTSRIGAPLVILLFPAASFAAPSGPALVTPALLSMNSLATTSTPELRIVTTAFAREGGFTEKKFESTISMPAPLRAASSRAFVQRGVEALARYSASRVDESPTPWQEGIRAPSSEDIRDRDQRFVAGAASVRVIATQEATGAGAMAFAQGRPLDAHAGTGWSADPHSSASLQSIGETSTISIVRTLTRVAGPVLEMADGLRAMRLNQVRVGDGLTLKLDGRTGRHARCFAILTQRF